MARIKLKTKLRSFQKEGVQQIKRFHGRAILGDEQGLGKTLQALLWIKRTPRHRPVVIVTPSTAKYVWQSEAHQHFEGMNIRVLEGRRPKRCMTVPGKIVVINYDILKSWLPALLRYDPTTIIFDEFHYLANPSSQRTRASHRLAFGANSVIGLSGTPITNELIGLWAPLQIIKPNLFPDFAKFAWEFTEPFKFRGVWQFKGAQNKRKLRKILRKRVLIRRLKKDVAKELPPKIHTIVPLRIFGSKLAEYKRASHPNKFLGWVRQKFGEHRMRKAKKNIAMARVGYLLRLCAELKLKLMGDWIEEWTLAHPGKKLVCMTMHTKVINYLHERFKDSVVINGKVRGLKREEAKRKFQNNKRILYCFGNWKACGIALTLTAAHNLVCLDLPWTPGDLSQGQDRVHRIGQLKRVTIYYLMLLGTLEEKLFEILREKTGVFEEVFNDDKESSDLNILKELARELSKQTK